MATIGLDRMFFAPITEDSEGNETYGTPEKLAKAMTVEMEIEVLEATLYADDGPSESVKEFGTGTITLGVDDIGVNTAEKLTGAQIDENHVVIAQSEGGGGGRRQTVRVQAWQTAIGEAGGRFVTPFSTVEGLS